MCPDDGCSYGSDPFDLDRDFVAWLEEAWWSTRISDAVGCAGDDEVTGIQSHRLTQVGQDVADAEDHVRGVSVLHDLAVDAGDDAQAVPRITHFIRGDDLAHRTALVGILADGPLSGAVLGLARSEIVERGVTEHGLQSFRGRHVFQSLADDCNEFALPIQAQLAGWDRRRRA